MKRKVDSKSQLRPETRKKKGRKKIPRLGFRPPKEQIQRLSCAVESLRDAVYITDLDHTIIYANLAIEFVQGYKPKEVVGVKAGRFFEGIKGNPPDLAGLIKKEAKDGFWIGEVFNRKKDNTVFPVQLILNTIYGEEGKVLGYVGISRDITERKQIEKAFLEEERRFRDIAENALEWIWEVDKNGKYIYASPVVEKILGYKPEEMLGKYFYDLFHSEDRKTLKNKAFKAFAGHQPFREFINRNVDRNGKVVWLSTSGVPILDEGGKLIGYRGADIDITELKRAEQRLQEKSKMEAIGTIALSVAHEFNNILMGMSGYAQLAQANLSNRNTVRKAFEVIFRQTQRGKALIQRLNIFGRREKPQFKPLDITRFIDEVIAIQARELQFVNIRVKRNYQPSSPVRADRDQLEQVFFNLLLNAQHALSSRGGGNITITVRDKGKWVEARITDQGVGIPPDEITKIFLPFYTTKTRIKEGMVPAIGLGLWISKQIIEDHRGTITVTSKVGRGTTFIVKLPRAEAVTIITGDKEIFRKFRSHGLRGQRVLVVDDEPDLLDVYEMFLEDQGVTVSTAINGKAALELCRKCVFDAIVLDYIMPGLAGHELVVKVRNAAPTSKLFIISGQPIPKKQEQELKRYIDQFLNKPLKLEELASLLENRPVASSGGRSKRL